MVSSVCGESIGLFLRAGILNFYIESISNDFRDGLYFSLRSLPPLVFRMLSSKFLPEFGLIEFLLTGPRFIISGNSNLL